MRYEELKQKYPKFVYQKYSYQISGKNLEIFFDFRIEPDIYFKPKVIIENIEKPQNLNNLIFHLGLIEMISYWKATCSPEIIIKAGSLSKEQIRWWKDLIMQGLGQFFYENKIPFQKPKIISHGNKYTGVELLPSLLKDKYLVPVGGGRDSVVTLEIFKKARKNIKCFSLNPTEAALKIMKMASTGSPQVAGCKKPVIVRRKIDEKLLELNRQGFLNGHTPFSAYLAFLSVLVATIFGQRYIAFSNERSSNEGNVKYLGKIINHQWSKSFDFEKKFRDYCQKYLTPVVKEDKSSFPPSLPQSGSSVVEYFSFLRPLYEIQIAKLFSKFPKYFSAFLSCNVAYQTASGTKKPTKKWCGNCPKCLFVFATLYPFVDGKELLRIFRKNLFEDQNLLTVMLELIGERKFKPFECVGTKKESLIAFYLSWKKVKRVGVSSPIPFLLNYFEKKILPKYLRLEKDSKKILNSWNNQHNLPKNF